jgi:EAL domain-containing protein (putative c-di-GMP-specific phosphodiesterase class I)
MAEWGRDPSTRHLLLAVNISARQFRQSDFTDQVQAALQTSGADPSRLKLELTESLVLADPEQATHIMKVLRELGVMFSMDDFGTGYSSLAYLKRLPLDQLKIDQSFVRDIPDDANSCVIAKAIIALGHSLGLKVIAEGVETQAQRDFLAGVGCLAYQGYLFGRPASAGAIEALLRGWSPKRQISH